MRAAEKKTELKLGSVIGFLHHACSIDVAIEVFFTKNYKRDEGSEASGIEMQLSLEKKLSLRKNTTKNKRFFPKERILIELK